MFLVLFSVLFEVPKSDIGTASTYLLSVVGFLILIDMIKPLNKYHIMVFVICVLGFIVRCSFTGCSSLYATFVIHCECDETNKKRKKEFVLKIFAFPLS